MWPKFETQNRFFLNYGKVFNWINTKFSAFVYLYRRNSNPEGEVSSYKIHGFMADYISKLKWAWQAQFWNCALQILRNNTTLVDLQMMLL